MRPMVAGTAHSPHCLSVHDMQLGLFSVCLQHHIINAISAHCGDMSRLADNCILLFNPADSCTAKWLRERTVKTCKMNQNKMPVLLTG